MKGENFTGYNNFLLERARKLRKNMTRQEKHLWYDFLCTYPIKFYRQRPIDRFIVDFYCSRAHLVIELDGSQHYTQDGMKYDQLRTDILERYQLEVIRFPNSDVDRNFHGTCKMIDQKVKEQLMIWD